MLFIHMHAETIINRHKKTTYQSCQARILSTFLAVCTVRGEASERRGWANHRDSWEIARGVNAEVSFA